MAAFENRPLPESVRYALAHRGGRINKQHILSLARSHFYNLALYLGVKSLDEAPDQQKELIRDLSYLFAATDSYQGMPIVLQDRVPEHADVEGQKIGQVMRAGYDFVEERFAEIGETIFSNGNVPVMLAYSSFLGFKPIVSALPEGKQLLVVMPKRIERGMDFIGLRLQRSELGDVFLEDLVSGDLSGLSVTLIDDTKKTGDTFGVVREYVEERGAKVKKERYIFQVNGRY